MVLVLHPVRSVGRLAGLERVRAPLAGRPQPSHAPLVHVRRPGVRGDALQEGRVRRLAAPLPAREEHGLRRLQGRHGEVVREVEWRGGQRCVKLLQLV